MSEETENNSFIQQDVFFLSQQFVLQAKEILKKEKEALMPESFFSPFNVCEILVETELNLVLACNNEICGCIQCRTDIIALSLKELPVCYIADSGDNDEIRQIACKYMERTMIAVHNAAKIVHQKPRKACKKISRILWINQNNLDWAV